MKRIELSQEYRNHAIESIKKYFRDERDEEAGDLAAALLLDYITDNIGPFFYNQGIKDACAFMSEKVEDMYGLEKRPRL